MAAERAGPAPRVAYTGLAGSRASRRSAPAQRRNERIVAVTFLLGGRPVGTDTTAPFELDVDACSRPPAGTGWASSRRPPRPSQSRKPVRVSVTPQEEPATLTATPATFRRVLRALSRTGT